MPPVLCNPGLDGANAAVTFVKKHCQFKRNLSGGCSFKNKVLVDAIQNCVNTVVVVCKQTN